MLEQVDLKAKLAKDKYKTEMETLQPKLGKLQRQLHDLGVPVIVVFEGWDASGKGTLINRLLMSLDPRGYSVYATTAPNEEDRLRPWLARFWKRTPAKGRMSIFDRSWYGRVSIDRVEKLISSDQVRQSTEDILAFERQLANDGVVLIKFFLHITPGEQKRRFEKLESNSATAWKVIKDDWRRHHQYKLYAKATEDFLAATDAEHAPWTIVEACDRRFATVKVFRTVIDRLTEAASRKEAEKKSSATKKTSVVKLDRMTTSILDRVNLDKSLDVKKYESQLEKYQQKIRDLEHEIYVRRIPVIVAYEGWDAAGKGGNIRRLAQSLDPRGYQVVPIAAPNDIERSHHWLWRFWTAVPKAGHIAVFDRTWYGRVLVERVEGFAPADDWRRAYHEINETEKQWTDFGAVVVKFWLEISKAEQLRRFKARQASTDKQWKITDEDWRNRRAWPKYRLAVDEMLYRTSTAFAPWTIVESDCKYYARIKTLKTIIDRIEQRLSK
jgi:polyphosphate:AMP phosphotransferase